MTRLSGAMRLSAFLSGRRKDHAAFVGRDMAWIARSVQVCRIVSEWGGHCLWYGVGVLMESAWCRGHPNFMA